MIHIGPIWPACYFFLLKSNRFGLLFRFSPSNRTDLASFTFSRSQIEPIWHQSFTFPFKSNRFGVLCRLFRSNRSDLAETFSVLPQIEPIWSLTPPLLFISSRFEPQSRHPRPYRPDLPSPPSRRLFLRHRRRPSNLLAVHLVHIPVTVSNNFKFCLQK